MNDHAGFTPVYYYKVKVPVGPFGGGGRCIIRRSTGGLNDGVPSLKEGGGVLVRLELDSTFLLLLVPSIPSISYS